MVTGFTVVIYLVMYKNDKSLSSAPETNIILYINSISMKIKRSSYLIISYRQASTSHWLIF